MIEPVGDGLAYEVDEIREQYRLRNETVAGRYSFLDPVHARLVLGREQAILDALGRLLFRPLEEVEVLDVGSSSGISLALLAAYGADPARLHGVDTDESRIARGLHRFPGFDLRVSDGMTLPYADDSFDLVQQVTMLSSVHSDELRRQIAGEMLRVVRPGGLVLSYDTAPVSIVPRGVNRLLRLAERDREAQQTSAASGRETPLRQIRPLGESDLRSLFAPAEPLEIVRLSPYRPLLERVRGRAFASAVLSLRPFATALLYVAQAPAG